VFSFAGKLYRNSGTYQSPTWVLVDNVGTIDVTLAPDKTELPLRKMGGWKAFVPGLFDYMLAFKMLYDLADASQSALRTAFFSRAGIEFLILDQAYTVAGAYGIRATMGIFKFPRTEEIEGAMMVDVELAPTYAANAPSEYTAAGS
jgi:hypothetical protein